MSILNHVWLGQILGGKTNNAVAIIEKFGIEGLYDARNSEEFCAFLTKPQQQLINEVNRASANDIVKRCEKNNIQIITIRDVNYPQRLLELANPPVVIYIKGDVKLLSEGFRVAIVGTRTPSKYASDATRLIAETFTQNGATIVSGLAEGLDGIGHATAISEKTPTVAVLGNSLDVYYPSVNREMQLYIERNGAVVSEIAPGSVIHSSAYLIRNRIIAALSDIVIVAEARKKSGSLETARVAIKLNRTLLAIPGNILSPLGEGTNHLIHEGAIPIVNVKTMLNDCGLKPIKRKIKSIEEVEDYSPLALKIFKYIPTTGIGFEEIYSRLIEKDNTGLTTASVLVAITELELNGAIERAAGGVFFKSRRN